MAMNESGSFFTIREIRELICNKNDNTLIKIINYLKKIGKRDILTKQPTLT